MEFNEKLQELRKQKGLTQEELAERLYVSRTAISKWESGRGYPNIDSLCAIAAFFSVTVDELLSSEKVLHIAKEEGKQKEAHLRDLVYGLLDACALLFLVLPLFAQRENGAVLSVSLLNFSGVQLWLRLAYWICVMGIVATGILTLALQNCRRGFWLNMKKPLSLAWSGAAMLLFIVGLQPYAAVFAFVLLAIKTFWLLRRT